MKNTMQLLIALVLIGSGSALAGGDQHHGDKGQGAVVQTQVRPENPPIGPNTPQTGTQTPSTQDATKPLMTEEEKEERERIYLQQGGKR